MKIKIYLCPVCGYIFTDSAQFEKLSDSWECPICATEKQAFEEKWQTQN